MNTYTEQEKWIECLPSDATMVRIGGAEFDYRPESCGEKDGGVIDGCFFNERGFMSLKATFWKPVEPVTFTLEFDSPAQSKVATVLIPKEIDPTKPFTLTITQNPG